jgi:hypothetical protein
VPREIRDVTELQDSQYEVAEAAVNLAGVTAGKEELWVIQLPDEVGHNSALEHA